mmetsp:Transcript_6617/g.10000  ORF Transcript_6617/g.10000 Transcript_6617/m.10000 type:complete len:165 (+) Transcript_6617:66-560(+)
MHYITIIGLALVCCQGYSLEASDESIKSEASTKFSTEDIAALFTANGRNVSITGDETLEMVFNVDVMGNQTVIITIGNSDISMYYYWLVLPKIIKNSDVCAAQSVAGNWNSNKYFSTLYFDGDGDFVLQSDLLLCDDHSSNVELVGKFVSTFIKSATIFIIQMV